MNHHSNRSWFLQTMAQTSDAPLMLEIERAEGNWMIAPDGKRYLDLISGISVSSLGHGNKAVIDAIQQQLQKHMHLMVYGEVVQQPQMQLAEALGKVLPEHLNNFYFVNSGSEAVEGAMKLAKRFTRRSGFVAQLDAYHGSTQGALSLMSNPYYSDNYKPLLPDIHFIGMNDIEALNNIEIKPAAVVMELVQAERGCLPATQEYVSAVKAFCKATGALLIIDEIQTGLGRTGTMFAFEQYHVEPDILLLGKALGGGMPMGAFVAPKYMMEVLSVNPVLGHITTFGGHPVCCAAATAAVHQTTDRLQEFEVNRKEQLFRSLLQHPKIRAVEGKGLLLAAHLKDEKTCRDLIAYALTQGVFTDWFLYAPHALRIAPPLTITDEEITFACETIVNFLNFQD
jgi:acetylornithine/succinyldiaminopimelate/putrescine aminotransferase